VQAVGGSNPLAPTKFSFSLSSLPDTAKSARHARGENSRSGSAKSGRCDVGAEEECGERNRLPQETRHPVRQLDVHRLELGAGRAGQRTACCECQEKGDMHGVMSLHCFIVVAGSGSWTWIRLLPLPDRTRSGLRDLMQQKLPAGGDELSRCRHAAIRDSRRRCRRRPHPTDTRVGRRCRRVSTPRHECSSGLEAPHTKITTSPDGNVICFVCGVPCRTSGAGLSPTS